jgi:hypothetical protein
VNDARYRNWTYVKEYSAWRKALSEDAELRGVAASATAKPYGVDPRIVALFIADAGTNGFNCYPSIEKIAGKIGCSPRTVWKWRAHLIHIGWFRVTSRTAGSNGRSLSLDIAIPGDRNEQTITDETTPNGTRAEHATTAGDNAGRQHAGY